MKALTLTLLFLLTLLTGCSQEEITTQPNELDLQVEINNEVQQPLNDQERGFGCSLNWVAPIAPFGSPGYLVYVYFSPDHVPLSEINCVREFYFTNYCEEIKMNIIQNSDPRRDLWRVRPCADSTGTGKSTFNDDVDNDPRTECTGC